MSQEFPVVLVRWGEPNEEGKRVLEKIDSFRSYVRPTWRPILTDFCKSLTGIQQVCSMFSLQIHLNYADCRIQGNRRQISHFS